MIKIKDLFSVTKIVELNENNEVVFLDVNKKKLQNIEFQKIEGIEVDAAIKATCNNKKRQFQLSQSTDSQFMDSQSTDLQSMNLQSMNLQSENLVDNVAEDLTKGHRFRLREKILNNNIENFKDYEILESLLTYAIPRQDVKPIAKKLLSNYKSLKNIIAADVLVNIKGVGEGTRCFFKLINEVFCRFIKQDIINEIVLENPEKVVKYCEARMSGLMVEQFRVIFLNRKNRLLRDEILQSGTIDKSAVFPREIVKRALELAAGAVILVHNHPTGDPTPSKADIDITVNIQKALQLVEIYLYDHIIIGKQKHCSMRSQNIGAF